MSDNAPHDGTTKPETDAATANPEHVSSYEPGFRERTAGHAGEPTAEPTAEHRGEHASERTQAEDSAERAAADSSATEQPATDESATDQSASAAAADDRSAHAAAVAAATERANSGSLLGEYTESDLSSSATNPITADTQQAPSVVPTAAPAAAPVPATAPAINYTPEYVPAQSAALSPVQSPVQAPLQTPIYVQAPTPPKDRSNRGGGILIAVLATIVYAALYAAAVFTIVGLSSATITETTRVFTEFTVRPLFYVPVIFFFLSFALLVSVVNRAGWWAYVLFGFLVAIVVYVAYVGSVLLTVQAWTLSQPEVAGVLSQQWFAPFAIAAAVIAREVPIWFGAWISRRGRSVTSRNQAARTEYERVLAEGPQIARPSN